MSTRIPPSGDFPEPVYIYPDPTVEPISLAGLYLDQKAVGRIRTIRTNPEDMDRLCQTPMLKRDSNQDYASLHQGGPFTEYQRNLNQENMQRISTWWDDSTSLSPNPPLVWLPGGTTPAGFDAQNGNSQGQISPATWAVLTCICGQDATQYDAAYANQYFDSCRACGWNGRPGMIIDGQHRIRGMAARNTPTDRHQVPIFVTLVVNQPPNGVSQQIAARMFIEINGGATDLVREHKDYLSSHFGILEFSTERDRAAYKLAAQLNIAAGHPHDEWWQDTSTPGKSGRVSMLEKFRLDFIPAFRITDWAKIVIGKNYDVMDMSGTKSSAAAYTWPSVPDTLVPTLKTDFSNYLYAATAIWPGTSGVRGAMPTWNDSRGGSQGSLQDGAVIRTLLNLLPLFRRRIMERGSTPNDTTFQEELRLISNITWSGNWNSGSGWLKGDGGIGRVSRVLSSLISEYPNTGPPTGAGWASLSAWFGGPHDNFSIATLVADTNRVTFTTSTVCSIQPSLSKFESLIGSGDGFLEMRLTPAASGTPGTWVTLPVKIKSTTNVEYPSGFTPAVGDTVEVRVSTSTALNDTQVQDASWVAGAPASTTVI